jgi:arylsulfatase A-like enzyme
MLEHLPAQVAGWRSMHRSSSSGPLRARHLLALGLMAWGAGLAACRPEPGLAGEGRGVLLIAVDALRADRLSSAGYDRPTTPRLDALAEAGIAFEDAWATAPWGLPSAASLLTGCDPFVARRLLPAGIPATRATRWNVPRQAPRLAAEYLRAGWRTAAFVDDPDLAPVRGFQGGFQVWVRGDAPARTREPGRLTGAPLRLAQWLRTLDRSDDWFAFLQVSDLERVWDREPASADGDAAGFEPRDDLAVVPPVGDAEHLFHAIPRPRWSGGLHTLGEYEARYDDALRRVDASLGEVLAQLELSGRLGDTTVCVVGSFGMSFGEGGLLLDHGTFSDADLRVPWILKPADTDGLDRGQRVADLASLLDVAPTLLALSRLDVPPTMHGVSFARRLRGEGEPPRDFLVARCAFQDGYAVIERDWKLELTRPWIVDDPILAASWYGSPPPYDEPLREVLVARSSEPSELERAAAAQRLCELGKRWVQDVERLRRGLQTVDWLLSTGLEVLPDAVPLGSCAAAQAEESGR